MSICLCVWYLLNIQNNRYAYNILTIGQTIRHFLLLLPILIPFGFVLFLFFSAFLLLLLLPLRRLSRYSLYQCVITFISLCVLRSIAKRIKISILISNSISFSRRRRCDHRRRQRRLLAPLTKLPSSTFSSSSSIHLICLCSSFRFSYSTKRHTFFINYSIVCE